MSRLARPRRQAPACQARWSSATICVMQPASSMHVVARHLALGPRQPVDRLGAALQARVVQQQHVGLPARRAAARRWATGAGRRPGRCRAWRSKPAFLGDGVVGRVDGGELAVAMSRNSAGTPSPISLSGWLSATSLRYCVLISALVASGAQAQDVVGVVVVGHEARAEEAELAVGEAEAAWRCRAGPASSRGCRMPSAAATCIRPSSTCCSSFRSSLSSAGDLVGIGLVAGHVLLAPGR